jgi:peptidyl-prolyl cis-trans isomerase C
MLLAFPAWAEAKKPAAEAAPADPVVARIDKVELHRSDVMNAMRALPPQLRQQPADKLYPMVLNNMIAEVLLSQAGRKAKLADDPLVKKRLAQVQDQLIAEAYVEQLVGKSATEQKLHANYDKYVKDAPPREEVSARHILLPTEADAKAVIEELKKGADFAKLAKEKTTDPAGKSSGGELGYFTKEDMVPEFADAAFKLKKGEYTQTPVKTQFGWHVIKLEDKRPGKAGTYEQVAPEIAQQMTQQIVAAKLQELRAQAKIEAFGLDGKPLASAAPAPQQQQPAQPVAPTLAIPGGGLGGNPPPPTLSPATAPDQLGK